MKILDRLLATPATPTPQATIIVFGATGDLVTDHGVRKALGDLVTQNDLVEGKQRLVFTSRRDVSGKDFLDDVKVGDPGDPLLDDHVMGALAALGHLEDGNAKLTPVDLTKEEPFGNLPEFRDDEVVLFYGALPPSAFAELIERLVKNGMMEGNLKHRLVLEKPFGANLEEAKTLAAHVKEHLDEEQVYLVDHFLMYPGMLEWLSLRSQPGVEAAMCKDYVCPDVGVHIILNEKIMSNDRAYFRETGILEDMLQNHAMQILANSCMGLDGAEDAEAWRQHRLDVVQALRWTDGEAQRAQVEGFNDVARGAPAKAEPSAVETFASVAFTLDLDRWRDIPMRMTAGKGVDENRFGLEVALAKLPPKLAEELGISADQKGCLKIDVKNGKFELETDGGKHSLKPALEQPNRPAYSRVFIDALHGEHAFFVAPAESVAAWTFIDKVQTFWAKDEAPLRTYPEGASIAELIAKS